MLIRIAAIVVLGFMAFGSMLSTPFRVMDDRISIIENPVIKSLSNIPAIFKEGYFHDQSYYRPLINLSFLIEYHLFGLRSFFYNLDNLLLHIFNAFLVLLLVARLTQNDTIAFWSAILFVMHPVQWEAVCNVPGRSILLSAFFVLSSFVLFLEFYKERRWYWGFLAAAAFFLGLLCKESAAMLLVVSFAYVALNKPEPWTHRLKSLWPFAMTMVAYVLLRKFLGMTNVHQTSQPLVYVLGFVTFLRSVITDLRLFLLPVDLHYDRCLAFMMSMAQPQAWGTCLFWGLSFVALAFYHRRIQPFVLFLMAWFVIELLPVSQLVASVGVGAGHVSTAEHFLYLASVPVFIGMVMAFRWVYDNKQALVKPAFLKFLAGGFLVFLLLISIEQSIYASNEFNMISRSLAFEPDNPRVQSAMAMLSVFRNDIPDAEKHFRAAVNADPFNPTYHVGLGTALCQQGKWIEGLEQFVVFEPLPKDKDLVKRQEKLTMTHIQDQLAQGQSFDARGWLAIGIYEAQTGQNDAAIQSFQKTISLDAVQPDAWFNLGSLYEAEGNPTAARKAFAKLLTLPGASAFQRKFVLNHLSTSGKPVFH